MNFFDAWASLPAFYVHLLALVLGLFCGSFLNLASTRMPRNTSLWWPGSHCDQCLTPLKWYWNIPLFSWLFLGGRCRVCGTPITAGTLVIETLTPLLWMLALRVAPWGPFVWFILWPFVSFAILLSVIDIRHRIIPHELNAFGLLLGLVSRALLEGPVGVLEGLGASVVAFFGFALLSFLYEWRRGYMGLGGGDVRLLAVLAAFVGLEGLVSVLFMASVTGMVAGLLLRLKENKGSFLRQSIPFGPFLVWSGLLVYLFPVRLWVGL
jgi:leader peptidase (prepilin peptidase) / N-methyltransferase